jgi:hypothetical protein
VSARLHKRRVIRREQSSSAVPAPAANPERDPAMREAVRRCAYGTGDTGERDVYVAVCKWGFGTDEEPAMAIARCQLQIPDAACNLDRAQLLLYKARRGTEPTGFGEWANGDKPRLVGLTNCAQMFERRPKI